MQGDVRSTDCNDYHCVDEGGGIIRCYDKDDKKHNNPLETFTIGATSSPTSAFDNARKIAERIEIEHAKIYINNKPGTMRAFGIDLTDGIVTFSTKERHGLDTDRGSSPKKVKTASASARPLFALKSDYVVVDNSSKEYSKSVTDGKTKFKLDQLLLTTKNTISQGILVGESMAQCQMLFGTSGSGKTKKAAEIMSAFVSGDATATLVSIKAIYGQAEMTNEYLRFKHIKPDGYNIEITKKMKTAFYGDDTGVQNFDGDGSTKPIGLIPLVQMTLQFMSDPSLTPLKNNSEFPIHFVTQTVNNSVSSRCLTAYTILRSDGRKLILFDAPGNENAVDIIKGMFNVNETSLSDDELVRLILDSTLEATAKRNGGTELTGTLPVVGNMSELRMKGVLSYHDLDSDEQKSMRIKATDQLNKTRQTFTGFIVEPAAFIPGVADRNETNTPQNRAKHLKYCQMRVLESLYINLLIGEMTRTLDMSKATGSLKQVSPFVTVKGEPDSTANGVMTFSNHTRYCVTGEECTLASVRAMYVDEDSIAAENKVTVDEMDKKHRSYRIANSTPNILNTILPIQSLQDGAKQIRAVIVVPVGCDSKNQREIIQTGVKKLSEQLIGRLE